jgi:luciferase family oxidoreductase group 1
MTLARLSVLDQSPVSEGMTGGDALRNTIDLARRADDLGFHRYWLAEHHGGAMLAGPSPEALIGPVAAATRRIRVGSGGVMLPHYSPFKVAETFSLLSGLFPERIDLGIGRAAGTDPLTTYALQRDRRQASPDDFLEHLTELMAYLNGTMPEDHPFRRLQDALPGAPEVPDVWLLGSSAQSAIWAAQLGLPYAFADFINNDGSEIAATYRERFQFSETLRAPRTAVAVWALAAESEEEARRLHASSRMSFAELRRGRLIQVPPPQKALQYLQERGQAAASRRAIVGTAEQVRAGLEEVADAYGAEEAIVVTITHDHGARVRSYELIAEAFGLEADAVSTGAQAGNGAP